MYNIYFSPSYHGTNANKCLNANCYEDKHTRPIAEVAARILKENGFNVKVAAPTTGVLNGARTKEADEFKADLYVPVHTNAYGDKSVRYLMFMFYGNTPKYRKVFNAVAPCLEEVYPHKTSAIFKVRKDLYEINSPKAITLYCELGFHTNKEDCEEFIHKPEMVGKALAKGIAKYFGVEIKTDGVIKHTVSKGETLYGIGKKYGIEWKLIAAENGISEPYTIHIGQILIIPEKKTAGTGKIAPAPVKTLKVGSKVKIKVGAVDLNSKNQYASFVYRKIYTVMEIAGNRVVFGLNGFVTGVTDKSNIIII